MRLRDWLVAAALAVAGASTLMLPVFDPLRGLSVDTLFWLRNEAFGPRHDPASSPVVVVAIDEETRLRPPFASVPQAIWTHEIARVLNALVESGVAVVGF